MTFRLRSMDSEDPSFEEKEGLYRRHVETIAKDAQRQFIDYFGVDFFHDGEISNLKFSPDMRDVEAELECPNISRKAEKRTYIQSTIKFKVEFKDVALFAMDAERMDKMNDPFMGQGPSPAVVFDRCEINTLAKEMKHYSKKNKRDMNSIVILTMPFMRVIKIVFNGIYVNPLEPLAFEVIRQSADFKVPSYFSRT